MASFGSVRDATRAWDATSYEGNEAVLDSGWATARPPGAMGSRDGRPRGSRDGRPRGSRDGRPQGSRDGRPQGSRDGRPQGSRDGRPQGSRDGRPQGSRDAGLVAELFGVYGRPYRARRARRRPGRFPYGFVWVGTGYQARRRCRSDGQSVREDGDPANDGRDGSFQRNALYILRQGGDRARDYSLPRHACAGDRGSRCLGFRACL